MAVTTIKMTMATNMIRDGNIVPFMDDGRPISVGDVGRSAGAAGGGR